MEEKKINFEATIHDIRMHNSKSDDNSWADITVRALGELNIASAMAMYKAKNKIVKLTFELEDD